MAEDAVDCAVAWGARRDHCGRRVEGVTCEFHVESIDSGDARPREFERLISGQRVDGVNQMEHVASDACNDVRASAKRVQ